MPGDDVIGVASVRAHACLWRLTVDNHPLGQRPIITKPVIRHIALKPHRKGAILDGYAFLEGFHFRQFVVRSNFGEKSGPCSADSLDTHLVSRNLDGRYAI